MKLNAALFKTDGTGQFARLNNPQSIGIRWSLFQAFGVERIEVIVPTTSKFDTYYRLQKNLGKRLVLYPQWGYRPISGYVSEVRQLDAGRVLYVAKGPGWRHYDRLITDTFDSTDTIKEVLVAAINTANVEVLSGDVTNIDANAVAIGGWQTKQPGGNYPGDIINDLLKINDGSGDIFDYWVVDERFNGTALQGFIPYYRQRSATGTADWIVSMRDCTDFSISRDLNNMATIATIYYGMTIGTANGGSSETVTRAAGSWITGGVQPGDQIAKVAGTGALGKANIIDVQATTITHGTLSDSAAFQSGDTWAIERKGTPSSVTDSVGFVYWDKGIAEYEAQMDSTQATQYAAMLLDALPSTSQSFTISSPYVRDSVGAQWPLWEVIARGGGYIRVENIYPTGALFTQSQNSASTFFITAMDYDYTSNKLRVNVDRLDTRLDARLRRAGILQSEMINR